MWEEGKRGGEVSWCVSVFVCWWDVGCGTWGEEEEGMWDVGFAMWEVRIGGKGESGRGATSAMISLSGHLPQGGDVEEELTTKSSKGRERGR
jgi:hypothetical protein